MTIVGHGSLWRQLSYQGKQFLQVIMLRILNSIEPVSSCKVVNRKGNLLSLRNIHCIIKMPTELNSILYLIFYNIKTP